jgi:ribonuclease HI
MDLTLLKEQGLVSCSSPPPQSDILKYAIQLEFSATNNIAQYEGLVTGLQLAKDLSIR